jgi:DNA-binding LacI/PurR family transcriptional regulator
MGAQAVRLLHRLLTLRDSDADRPEQIWLQPELVVRASSTKSE